MKLKLPRPLLALLLHRVVDVVTVREPDRIIGHSDDPYLLRWQVIPRNRIFNVYLHLFCRSDDARALHDHPWASCSLIVAGSYLEHLAGGAVLHRDEGDVVFRRAATAHRVELLASECDGRPRPCWTLFLTGPVVRAWGFLCPQGWRPWREYVALDDAGRSGCEP